MKLLPAVLAFLERPRNGSGLALGRQCNSRLASDRWRRDNACRDQTWRQPQGPARLPALVAAQLRHGLKAASSFQKCPLSLECGRRNDPLRQQRPIRLDFPEYSKHSNVVPTKKAKQAPQFWPCVSSTRSARGDCRPWLSGTSREHRRHQSSRCFPLPISRGARRPTARRRLYISASAAVADQRRPSSYRGQCANCGRGTSSRPYSYQLTSLKCGPNSRCRSLFYGGRSLTHEMTIGGWKLKRLRASSWSQRRN